MQFRDLGEKTQNYLNGTYCYVRGPKVDGIYHVEVGGRVYLNNVETLEAGVGSVEITPAQISKYEFFTPRLGWVEGPNNAFYVERIPVRGVYKIGLCERSVTTPRIFSSNRINILRGLDNCHNKRYKSFRQALEIARTTKKTVPFSRKYAVTPQGGLLFKNEELGSSNLIKVACESDLYFHETNIASLCGGHFKFVVAKDREFDYDRDI